MWSAKKVPALVTGLLMSIALSPGHARADASDEDLYDFVQDRMTSFGDDRKEMRSQLKDEIDELKDKRAELKRKKEDKDKIKEIEAEIEQLKAEKELVEKLKSNVFNKIDSDSEFKTKLQPVFESADVQKAYEEAKSKHKSDLSPVYENFVKEKIADLQKATQTDDVKKQIAALEKVKDSSASLDASASGADNETLKGVREEWSKKKDDHEKNGPSELELRTVELENSPFDLVAKLERKDGDKWALKYDLKVKSDLGSVSDKVLTKKIRDDFKDTESIRDFLEKQVATQVNGKSINLDLKGKKLDDPAAKAEIERALKDAVKLSHKDLLYGDKDAALRSGVEDMLESRYGSDDTSEISQKKDELKEYKDNPDKREELAELEAKQRVAEWLRSNEPGNRSACEVIVEVFKLNDESSGLANWKKLPSATQQQCAEHSPEVKIKAAEAEKKRKLEESKARKEAEAGAEKQQRDVSSEADEAQAKADAEFKQLVQYCLGYYRNQSAQSGMKSIVDTVGPIYDALQKQGLGCKFFGEFMGQLSDPNILAYLPPNALQEKAFDIVHATSADKEGNEVLKKELKCLDTMVSMAGNSLGMVMGKAGELSPYGLQDPKIQADPKLQQLYRYFQAASELKAAVQGEIGARGQANQQRFQSVGGPNGGPMMPGSVGVSGGGGLQTQGASGNAQRGGDAARERRGLQPASPSAGSPGSTQPRATRPGL
jgi:hypothetical protein